MPATARWRCQPWSPTSPSVTQSLGGARRESRGRSPCAPHEKEGTQHRVVHMGVTTPQLSAVPSMLTPSVGEHQADPDPEFMPTPVAHLPIRSHGDSRTAARRPQSPGVFRSGVEPTSRHIQSFHGKAPVADGMDGRTTSSQQPCRDDASGSRLSRPLDVDTALKAAQLHQCRQELEQELASPPERRKEQDLSRIRGLMNNIQATLVELVNSKGPDRSSVTRDPGAGAGCSNARSAASPTTDSFGTCNSPIGSAPVSAGHFAFSPRSTGTVANAFSLQRAQEEGAANPHPTSRKPGVARSSSMNSRKCFPGEGRPQRGQWITQDAAHGQATQSPPWHVPETMQRHRSLSPMVASQKGVCAQLQACRSGPIGPIVRASQEFSIAGSSSQPGPVGHEDHFDCCLESSERGTPPGGIRRHSRPSQETSLETSAQREQPLQMCGTTSAATFERGHAVRKAAEATVRGVDNGLQGPSQSLPLVVRQERTDRDHANKQEEQQQPHQSQEPQQPQHSHLSAQVPRQVARSDGASSVCQEPSDSGRDEVSHHERTPKSRPRSVSVKARTDKTRTSRSRDRKSTVTSRLGGRDGPSLHRRLAVAMLALRHGMAPGASDKWKGLQLFHESLSKSQVRVASIDRVVSPEAYHVFCASEGVTEDHECEVVFVSPSSPEQLARVRESGLGSEDMEEVAGLGTGIPFGVTASVAHRRARGQFDPTCGDRCLCLFLCTPALLNGALARGAQEGCIAEPQRLLLVYTVSYRSVSEASEPNDESFSTHASPSCEPDRRTSPVERRRQNAKQQREYGKVRDPLIKIALESLERAAAGTMGTVLLPSTSVEAEAVVSLYLLGGGGARQHRLPGVNPREALGGVVVQRIENQPLFMEYSAQGQAEDSGQERSVPRYREDVVWHGTRLKRMDGEGVSLATKLQSIAEKGFEPQRCVKGAAAKGGIWVAMSPLASFGSGCDGLVAFVLCLSKTTFNEWVDTNCARVLQRERVLPLYSIVHA